MKPKIAAAFKETCVSVGVSFASVISQFMIDYSQDGGTSGQECLIDTTSVKQQSRKHCHEAKQSEELYKTRRLRRAAVKAIISQMKQISLAEEQYRDRIPENLQASTVYEVADESVALMHEIIELLEEIY